MTRRSVPRGAGCRPPRATAAGRTRRRGISAALGLLAGLVLSGSAAAQDEIPGRLVLQLTKGGARALAARTLTVPVPPGGAGLEPRLTPLFPGAPPPLDRYAVLAFRAERASDPRAQNALWSGYAVRSPEVATAEPDRVLSLSALPDDPYFSGDGGLPRQWHLRDPGGLSLDAARAWPFVPAESGVVVAVLDSGVDREHPDLGGSAPPGGVIRTNPAELGGLTGVDDDGNGYVDDVAGWDFVDIGTLGSLPQGYLPIVGEDGDDPDNDPSDVLGHGTYISGVITALDRNGIGLAAAAPGVRILPVRVGWAARDGGGKVAMSFCAQGLVYAAMNGARVANCSWDSADLNGLGAALDVAVDTYGMVVVGAAGNGNTSSTSVEYLASRGDCLGVAGVFRSGKKGTFSNYGPWVDIAGFYKGMVSTWITGGASTYDTTFQEGTSWAAPNVAALAAMLAAVDPGADAAAIRLAITSTGRDLADVEPTYAGDLGGGLVQYPDAVRALGGGWEADRAARGLSLTGDGGIVVLGDGALGRVTALDGTDAAGWAGGEPYQGTPEPFLPLIASWEGTPLVVWGEGGTLRGVREPGTAAAGWPVALPAGAGQPAAAAWPGGEAVYVPHGSDVLSLRPGAGTVDTLHAGASALAVSAADMDSTVLVAGTAAGGILTVWRDGPAGPSSPVAVSLGAVDTAPVIGEFEGPGLPEVVVAGPDSTAPAVRQVVSFIDGTGAPSRVAHVLDAAPIRTLSLAGFENGMSVRVAAVDTANVLHLFAPGAGPVPSVAVRDLGGPVTGEVLCADLDGDYQSDLLALRTDGTLLAYTAALSPLAGFPRHFPSGFAENPVIVDDGVRRRIVAADTAGILWSLPAGPAGRPAPWPQARGTEGRTGFLGYARAVPVAPAVSAFTWTWRDAGGSACWSGSGLEALARLRIRGGGEILWEGLPVDARCVILASPSGSLALEGLSRRGGWVSLASAAVGARPGGWLGVPVPNPFRAETRLAVSGAGEAPEVEVFDIQGRLVLRARSAERGWVRWSGTDGRGRPVPPGIYFVRVRADGSTATRRVIKAP
jgi:hypothetical protein